LSHTFVAVFFLNAASPTMIYTLSLHDALPILELLINNPDSVFVIEDAENIVIDRNLQNGSPVSGLLNLADGLLADCLNIQLICTFNTDLSNVDPALMRKGRLIASYEFGERSEEHTSELQSRENLVCRLLLEKKNHR